MRDGIKIGGLLAAGLFVAGIAYPLLHEAGHSIAAVLVGADVMEFNVFPLPNVLCNVSQVENMGKVFIGMGGILLPVLFSAVVSVRPDKSNFWIWYANTLLKGIRLLAAAIVLYHCGISIANEDFVKILELWPAGGMVIPAAMIFTTGYLLLNILRERPIKICLRYFGL